VSSRDALRGSFGLYRAMDITTAQNQRRATRHLTMPVLAIGGAAIAGDGDGLSDQFQVPGKWKQRCSR
jgi:hypothetical protein